MALQIFEHHTRHIKIDRSVSGAEWWVQVRRPSDSLSGGIGFHWDKVRAQYSFIVTELPHSDRPDLERPWHVLMGPDRATASAESSIVPNA